MFKLTEIDGGMSMAGRIIILIISLIATTILMSGGYGYWQKTLVIKGTITVLEPVTTEENLENSIIAEETKEEGNQSVKEVDVISDPDLLEMTEVPEEENLNLEESSLIEDKEIIIQENEDVTINQISIESEDTQEIKEDSNEVITKALDVNEENNFNKDGEITEDSETIIKESSEDTKENSQVDSVEQTIN